MKIALLGLLLHPYANVVVLSKNIIKL